MTVYFKKFNDKDAKAFEVTKEEARQTLEGYWDTECLDRIFGNEIVFRLFTPFAEVWVKKDGKVPMAGFYGICE